MPALLIGAGKLFSHQRIRPGAFRHALDLRAVTLEAGFKGLERLGSFVCAHALL